MYCPSCHETYSELQSLCPACFVALEQGAEDGAAEPQTSPFDGMMTVDWPATPDVAKLMADMSASMPGEAASVLQPVADAAAAYLPDESARTLAREALERVAPGLERRLPGPVRKLAHERLEQTVDELAGRVPDRNLRQAAEQAYRATAAGGPAVARKALESAQERAREFDAWYRQNAPNSVEPVPAPPVDLSANIGCMRLAVAFLSIFVAGLGQVVYGPRNVGMVAVFIWFLLLVSGQGGLLFLVGLVSALFTLVSGAIRTK